jgi:SAM-dependent methyltransferase
VASEERGRKHWNSVAQCWHLYSSPLRPCAEDLAAFSDFISAYGLAPPDGSHAALILGVTPEIATMRWPAPTFVTGADGSQEMIERVWPGDRPGLRRAICVDWFELLDPPRDYDLVLADGSLNTLGFPDDLRRLLARLCDIVQSGALFITRTFTRPTERESITTLEEVARAGVAGSFHAFKFRLAMALQQAPQEGVRLDEIWRLWRRLDNEIDGLSARNGWMPDVVGTIELFCGKQVRLSFPSRDELIATLADVGLTLLDSHAPGYEMGERCPIQAWRF